MTGNDFTKVLEDTTLWESLGDFKSSAPLGAGDPSFLYGVATSMFQDSGSVHCPESQWSAWEKRSLKPHERSGASVNLFELYRSQPLEIVKRLQLLSVNTYRFSIEWSHVEPSAGSFSQEHLDVYVRFCKILRDHEIQPLITLHHFSEPLWFHDLGSFEKEANIRYFLDFCKYVYGPLTQDYQGKPLVQYFCTINEPGIEAYCRYLVGQFSPNRYLRFKKGSRFLLNILKAHCQVYTELKKISGDLPIQIGISHQYLWYYHEHALLYPVTHLFNKFNQAILKFFKTGEFECKIPWICEVVEKCEKPKTDFVGVQFYGRVFLGLRGIHSKNKPATTMYGMHEDPEGLYHAILTVFEAFNAPVLISENGISTESDEQRARYLSRALYAAEKARQKIGPQNLIGYILWSFSDNFEWFMGWKPQFGAFALNPDRTLSDRYKPGVQPFVDTIQAWKKGQNSL